MPRNPDLLPIILPERPSSFSDRLPDGRRVAVLLDRDGTLNVQLEGDYVKHPGELKLLPHAARGLGCLNDLGVPVFVVSNQQGVAKGLMNGHDLARVDAALGEALLRRGAHIDRSYYCPHAETDGCVCRKPRPGLMYWAAREEGLDLSRSFMVGDSLTDVRAARAAGVGQFVLVLSGQRDKRSCGRTNPSGGTDPSVTPPDFVALNLHAAARWIALRMRNDEVGSGPRGPVRAPNKARTGRDVG